LLHGVKIFQQSNGCQIQGKWKNIILIKKVCNWA